MEEVYRIVLLLQNHKPIVIRAEGGLDAVMLTTSSSPATLESYWKRR